MEGLFDSVFPYLFIALFVGGRILLALRSRRLRRQRGEGDSEEAAPPKTARGFVPWEDAFREEAAGKAVDDGPGHTASDGGDEAFSAWNLSVDDGPAGPAAPPRPPEAPPRPSLAAAPAPFVAAPEPAARRPAPAIPGRRFRGLPPLQQGVIWAEILGAPKGL
jgi:hypothetical protein